MKNVLHFSSIPLCTQLHASAALQKGSNALASFFEEGPNTFDHEVSVTVGQLFVCRGIEVPPQGVRRAARCRRELTLKRRLIVHSKGMLDASLIPRLVK